MRACISLAREMPEGVYGRALKGRAEVVEGVVNDLLWDLVVCRYALQRAVDALWELDELPREGQVHQLLYPMLRAYGLRAHVAKNIYKAALALTRAAREGRGRRPTIKKLSARLDHQDAKVNVSSGTVKVILRSKWYVLKLMHRRGYLERFKGLRWREVHVKYCGGRLYVSVVFEAKYSPYAPSGILALDVNLKHVVAYDGHEIRRHEAGFTEALNKRARAEELQRRYPKRWRYNEGIKGRVRGLHRRARDIVADRCRRLAKELVLKARRRGFAIALEDLTHLRGNVAGKNRSIAWKLSMLAHRKLHASIMSKAVEYNVPVVIVEPRGTSSTCPRCASQLLYDHRLATCPRCGFIGDRDRVGAMNVWLRALNAYAGAPGSLLSAPAVKNEARRSGGTRDG